MAKQRKLDPILASLQGVAQVAVQHKASTKQFIDAVKAAGEAQGIDLSHINAAQYSILRKSAVDVRNGIESYHSAPGTAQITHEMLPATWFSRPLNERNLVSEVQASIAMSYTENGVFQTEYKTVRLLNFQFTTKDALENAIALEAQLLARNYGFEYHGHITTKLEAL